MLKGPRVGWGCRDLASLFCPSPVLGGMEVRWCTISDPEQQKCSDMSKAFQQAGIQPSVLCVQGTSADHCVQLITVSPLPSVLPRQEGCDSGGSTQELHSPGKVPKSPCQGWAIGSPEFPW